MLVGRVKLGGSTVIIFTLVTVLRVADAVVSSRLPRMPAMSEAACAAPEVVVDEVVELDSVLVEVELTLVDVLKLLEEVDVVGTIVTNSESGCPACGMMKLGAMLTAGCCGPQLQAAATAPP